MEFDWLGYRIAFIASVDNVLGLMEDRPDLLLGIIVTHTAKQQQPVAGKASSKTWTYSERQERAVTESAVTVRTTPTLASTPSTIIRETETIASPANQVTLFTFSCVRQ